MANTKDDSKRDRDRRICLLRRNGFTFSQIAQMEDISRVRVGQIVQAANAELTEDAGRAEIASALEFAEQKCVELITSPGPLMGPNGKPATDLEGVPVPNNGIVVEALKTLILVEDKKSRLFAWDKQLHVKLKAEEVAREEMRAHLEGMAVAVAAQQQAVEERHRAELAAARTGMPAVIPGEVVGRELAVKSGSEAQQGAGLIAAAAPDVSPSTGMRSR